MGWRVPGVKSQPAVASSVRTRSATSSGLSGWSGLARRSWAQAAWSQPVMVLREGCLSGYLAPPGGLGPVPVGGHLGGPLGHGHQVDVELAVPLPAGEVGDPGGLDGEVAHLGRGPPGAEAGDRHLGQVPGHLVGPWWARTWARARVTAMAGYWEATTPRDLG